MSDFFISGIQQVGVGTVDMRKSWDWYIDMFGIDIKILEDDTVAERMLPYTGNQPQKRHACIAVNLQGGGGLEIWQYSERTPVPVAFDIAVGDLGIFAAKIKCRDVKAFHAYASSKWPECGAVTALPDGTPCLYLRDLYGNYLQVVEQPDIYIEQHCLTGGVAGAVIGVTDMDASVRFYREVLGYEQVIYDETGRFDDWQMLPGSGEQYRRVLLKDPSKPKGPLSELMPKGCIELVQALDRTPRKIYEGRYWGDPGFIQLCFDITNMKQLGEFCASKGHPFTVDSCPDNEVFDMGDASGHFTYIEDPDGTLIEFVETHKIPVIKKIGWFIDLINRKREKPLPRFLFKAMGLVSREKVNKSDN
jgi:catechol 2,3-dioxygenase-like lactoylglutathione lyase family enzyme